MKRNEPHISVGILDHEREVRGRFLGVFHINGGAALEGEFRVLRSGQGVALEDGEGKVIAGGNQIDCAPERGGRFLLRGVTIGVQFHWERKEDQLFEGSLRFLLRGEGTIAAVNDILLEDYLKSVISSEMSAEAPLEFLKAHAIVSRSWLVAMLDRAHAGVPPEPPPGGPDEHGEIIRWYTREDHDLYDVCADDHCQRYQGVTKILSQVASEAVSATRGRFLLYGDAVCDARFSKSCGGITEEFASAWEDRHIPYLSSLTDGATPKEPVLTERRAEDWILSHPEAYCNTSDAGLLKQILPSFDQETTDFFRWEVHYAREELERILQEKSGFRFGILEDLLPLNRGPSGRITRLKVVGSEQTIVVGKELEIRRWLSPSHLYSSAFLGRFLKEGGRIRSVRLSGAGWGHGVGFCQIGAAVMCAKGFTAEEVALHYFPGARIVGLY